MKRYYIIDWYDNKRKIEHSSKITLSNPTGKVERDALAAANLFSAAFGKPKQNIITKIREFDENDNQIGEDITPMSDAVVPVKRVK